MSRFLCRCRAKGGGAGNVAGGSGSDHGRSVNHPSCTRRWRWSRAAGWNARTTVPAPSSRRCGPSRLNGSQWRPVTSASMAASNGRGSRVSGVVVLRRLYRAAPGGGSPLHGRAAPPRSARLTPCESAARKPAASSTSVAVSVPRRTPSSARSSTAWTSCSGSARCGRAAAHAPRCDAPASGRALCDVAARSASAPARSRSNASGRVCYLVETTTDCGATVSRCSSLRANPASAAMPCSSANV
jgi:hypothetical protein